MPTPRSNGNHTQTTEFGLPALLMLFETLRRNGMEQASFTAIETFFVIASSPGISVEDLQERINRPQSTASRTVAALGKWRLDKSPGLNLVRSVPDPANYRKRMLFLTSKGRRLIDSIAHEAPPFDFRKDAPNRTARAVADERMKLDGQGQI